MSEYAGRPGLPGYVSIKEAAKILGISDKRVYEYVDDGRLPSMWAADVIMIPLDAVKKFKRRSSGRPRKSNPTWRISSEDNIQYATSIFVQIRANQHKALMKKLEEIKAHEQHLFPGTIARYIVGNENFSGEIEIFLVWRSTVMPNEIEREKALEAFKQTLNDVLDWNTARYNYGKVFLHT